MNQQTYWDKAASKKEFTTPFQMDVFKSYVSRESVILDVGCGYGRTLNALYQEGFKNILGIDFSQKMIERGKHLYPLILILKNVILFFLLMTTHLMQWYWLRF
ncbi:MAG: class I SAM-dependent methyltransferase [Desulfobacula sp.]|nr:class I SAM-dependent methyltransferase [Desulfobacula sp.]